MINYIETHLCDHCNLKCRGCSHFSSIAPPHLKDLDDFKKEIHQLSQITNKSIKTFRLMGGEPLLHPQLLEFCKTTREELPFTDVVIASNGTLLNKLSDIDIDFLNKLNISLCVSDYGLNINLNQFAKFQKRYFYNKHQMYNIGLDLTGSQEIAPSFYKCDHVLMGCAFMKEHRIYQCAIMAQIDIFNNHFNQNITYDIDDISIDFFSHSETEILNFLRTPHECCKYCNIFYRNHSNAWFETTKGDINEWVFH